jgi:hypothetical protein
MPAKRLAVVVVPVLLLVSTAWTQVNDVSITAGRTFVSTQTIISGAGPDPHIHFGNEETVAFNYGRLLKTFKVFGLTAELPVAISPRMDVHTSLGNAPKDIGALFVTPSARVNFFPSDSVSPWVSAGGGYGRFREAPTLEFGLRNPGPTGTNTGVVQFGAGLDVWFWQRWGARFEARDFYSGVPALDVVTGRSRQHNYYVGVGVAHRF